MKHLSCLWRPLLLLSEEVSIFGYCAIIGMVICFCVGVKILQWNLIVLLGLGLANIKGMPLFGAQSGVWISLVCLGLWLLYGQLLPTLKWHYIFCQWVYSGLMLHTVPFHEFFSPLTDSLQSKFFSHPSSGLTMLYSSISKCWQTVDNRRVQSRWRCSTEQN